jgi:hypothetical protein
MDEFSLVSDFLQELVDCDSVSYRSSAGPGDSRNTRNPNVMAGLASRFNLGNIIIALIA